LLVTARGWTSFTQEAIPLRRFGIHTSGGCAVWLQFPLNLVRDSEKTALNQFRYDAEADASSFTKVMPQVASVLESKAGLNY
jgi:hypothetical protein